MEDHLGHARERDRLVQDKILDLQYLIEEKDVFF